MSFSSCSASFAGSEILRIRATNGAIADTSDSAKLRSANRLYRDTLVPMATPFYNAVFAVATASCEIMNDQRFGYN